MRFQTDFKMKAEFTVEAYFSGEKYLRINILDMMPDKRTSLEQLDYCRTEIEEWDFTQRDIEDLDIANLDEEKLYNGTFDVEFLSTSCYDNWSGATEYDLELRLTCVGHTENTDKNIELEYNREYSKIFHASGNKDGDFIYMKKLPSGKIHLDFAHCCVHYRGRFIDVTTLTACLAEHIDEYRKEKNEPDTLIKKNGKKMSNKFGPKDSNSPTLNRECYVCKQLMKKGDYTALIPLGPDDDENRKRAAEGKPYDAVAIEVHWGCCDPRHKNE